MIFDLCCHDIFVCLVGTVSYYHFSLTNNHLNIVNIPDFLNTSIYFACNGIFWTRDVFGLKITAVQFG